MFKWGARYVCVVTPHVRYAQAVLPRCSVSKGKRVTTARPGWPFSRFIRRLSQGIGVKSNIEGLLSSCGQTKAIDSYIGRTMARGVCVTDMLLRRELSGYRTEKDRTYEDIVIASLTNISHKVRQSFSKGPQYLTNARRERKRREKRQGEEAYS